MVTLWINEQQADIWSEEKLKLAITYSINDSRKLNTRKGSTSKTISIPASSTNKKILGFQEVPSSIDVLNNSYLPARIEEGSVTILEGHVKFMSANDTSYNIVIMGQNSDWITRLRQKNVNEIDFSDQNHTYNNSNITSSWTVASGVHYVYPLIDYGVHSGAGGATKAFSAEDMRPAINLGETIERMFNESGYVISSSFESTLRNYYIPFTNKTLKNTESFITGLEFIQFAAGTSYPVSSDSNNQTTIDIDAIGGTLGSSVSKSGDVLTVTGTSKMKFRYQVNTKFTTNPYTVTFRLISNNIAIFSKNIDVTTTSTVYNITTDWLDISNGSKLSWEFITAPSTSDTLFIEMAWTNEVSPEVVELAEIDWSVNLPDINQLDFISDIKTLFNLYFRTDDINKIVYFEPRDDFYNSLSSAVDWTDKRDLSKGISVEYLNISAPKTLNYTYKEDSNDYNLNKIQEVNDKSIGESTYTFDNVFTKNEANLNLKSFSPTYTNDNDDFGDLVARYGFVPVIPVLWSEEGETNSTPAFSTEFNYRLIYYNGLVTLSSGENFSYGGISRTSYPQAYSYNSQSDNDNNLLFADLSTGYGLMNRYYTNENATINTGKIVTMYFNLNASDINQLDERNPIQVENDFYYINKIVDYNPMRDGVTKVELVTVVETTKGLPSDLSSIDNSSVRGRFDRSQSLYLSLDENGNVNINHKGIKVLSVNSSTGEVSTGTSGGTNLTNLKTLVNGAYVDCSTTQITNAVPVPLKTQL